MVDAVSGLTSSTSNAQVITQAENTAGTLDFDAYLKLLLVQLENQDPLDPMDPNEMSAQLTSYSQLEQQIKTNTLLEQQLGQNDFSEKSLAVSYIGKEVLVPGDTVAAVDGVDSIDFAFNLNSTAASSLIQIRNSDGTLVREFDGGVNKGLNYATWDGTNDAGEELPAGTYTIQVSAADADGRIVQATEHTYTEVAAVETEGNAITLMLSNNNKVNFDDVLTIRAAQ